MRHMLDAEKPIDVICAAALNHRNLDHQAGSRMSHGTQIAQNIHRSRQMFQNVEHRDGVHRPVEDKTLEVTVNEFDSRCSKLLPPSFQGGLIDVNADLIYIRRQHRQKTAIITTYIEYFAAGTKQGTGQ